MRSKLISLTIMELLIVMALTSLVIYGAYFSLSSSRGFYNRQVKSLSKSLDLLEWDTKVLNSVRSSDNLKLTANEIFFQKRKNRDVLVLNDECLLFNQDSLRGKVLFMKFYRNGEEVNSGNLIDEFVIDIVINSDTVPLTYEKRYSAFQKLQFESWQE